MTIKQIFPHILITVMHLDILILIILKGYFY